MKKLIVLLAMVVVCQAALAGPITGVTVESYSGRLMSANDAQMSVDGDTETYWYSAINDGAWIVYDLGEETLVTEISLMMTSGWRRKLAEAEISVSSDAANFVSLGLFTIDTDDAAVTTIPLTGVTTRYVKIFGSKAYYPGWDPKVASYPDAPDSKYAISIAEVGFVPEPATISMMALGTLALIRRKK